MPGVYYKEPTGPRYDRLVATVEACRAELASCSPMGLTPLTDDLMNIHLPLLSSQLSLEKDCAEEFRSAGGLTVWFSVLFQFATSPSDADISPVLADVASLLCKEIDTFDEDINEIPLLLYFLTERDAYYVDINWNAHELILMQQFLQAYLKLLEVDKTRITDSLFLLVLETLTTVLLCFPPHRVVKQMAECFDTSTLAAVFSVLLNSRPFLWATGSGRKLVGQFLLGIASFGLGSTICGQLIPSQLHLALSSTLHSSGTLRCPCDKCEMARKFQKLARERDEWGVPSSSESKRQLCDNILRSGGINVVIKLLSCEASTSYEDTVVKPHGEPDHVHSIEKENQDKPQIGYDESQIEEATSHSTEDRGKDSSYCPDAKNKNEETAQTPSTHALLPFTTNEENFPLPNVFSKMEFVSFRSGMTLLPTNDDARCSADIYIVTTRIVILLSIAMNKTNMDPPDVLTLENFALLHGLLIALAQEEKMLFSESDGIFYTHIADIIEVISCLVLRCNNRSLQKSLLKIVQKPFEHLLTFSCEQFISRCGTQAENFTPLMSEFVLPYAALTAVVQLAGGGVATFDSTAAAAQLLIEGYQKINAEVSVDPKVFLAALAAAMATLAGVREYLQCAPNRRRFLSPPNIVCGFMVPSGRAMLTLYGQLCKKKSGCVYIKETLGTFILLAERASALQPL